MPNRFPTPFSFHTIRRKISFHRDSHFERFEETCAGTFPHSIGPLNCTKEELLQWKSNPPRKVRDKVHLCTTQPDNNSGNSKEQTHFINSKICSIHRFVSIAHLR